MKAGKEYELLVEKMYQSLEPKAIVTHDDYIYDDRAKIKRQIDVSIKHKLAGIDLLIIVQVKDYKIKADIKVVDQFIQVVRDLNANKGILVCSKGFSAAALTKAKSYGIECLTVNSALKKSWETVIEVPVLKNIHEFGLSMNIVLDTRHKAGREVSMMQDVFSYDKINLISMTDIIKEHIIDKMGWEYLKKTKKIRIDLKKINIFVEFDREMLPAISGFIEIIYLKSSSQKFLVKPKDYISSFNHNEKKKELHDLVIDQKMLLNILQNDFENDKNILEKPMITFNIYNYLSDGGVSSYHEFKFAIPGSICGEFLIKDNRIMVKNDRTNKILDFEKYLKDNI